MDDALTVDVYQCLDYLADVYPSLKLGKPLPTFSQILQGVVAAIFQQNIDILLILKRIDEFHDMPMSQ